MPKQKKDDSGGRSGGETSVCALRNEYVAAIDINAE